MINILVVQKQSLGLEQNIVKVRSKIFLKRGKSKAGPKTKMFS